MFEPIAFESTNFEPADMEPAKFGAEDLDVPESTGDIEVDCAEELAEVASAFEQRAKTEEKRRLKATDSEFWVCVCFQTREEVEEFLAKTGLAPTDAKYVDGRRLARLMGVKIAEDDTGFGKVKVDPKFAAMAMEA